MNRYRRPPSLPARRLRVLLSVEVESERPMGEHAESLATWLRSELRSPTNGDDATADVSVEEVEEL